jgi:hypothetical protein
LEKCARGGIQSGNKCVTFGATIFLFSQNGFSRKDISILRNIIKLRGLNFIINRNLDAQDQFSTYAGADNGDL